MIDDGWLFISGFNPLSLMGLRKRARLRKTPPCSRMFTLMRQLDWLSLLNFEVYIIAVSCLTTGKAGEGGF